VITNYGRHGHARFQLNKLRITERDADNNQETTCCNKTIGRMVYASARTPNLRYPSKGSGESFQRRDDCPPRAHRV
jgi:hypothetical protein